MPRSASEDALTDFFGASFVFLTPALVWGKAGCGLRRAETREYLLAVTHNLSPQASFDHSLPG